MGAILLVSYVIQFIVFELVQRLNDCYGTTTTTTLQCRIMSQLLMSVHFTQRREHLIAHQASVFLSRRNPQMNVHVRSHISTAGESIETDRALPFLFAGVCQHMFVEM